MKAKDMLKMRNAPRLPGLQLIATDTEQKQIRQHRDAKGLLNAPFILPYLMLTHPQIRFQFAIDLLNRPAFLVRIHNVSRRQLGQIGHQDFRLTRAHVPPGFAQNHRDITHVTQTQTRLVHLKRSSAIGYWDARYPGSPIILARQMGHQVFDRLSLNCFPSTRDGKDKTPSTIRVLSISLKHHLHKQRTRKPYNK